MYGVTKERHGAVVHGWKATPKAVCWAPHENTVTDATGSKNASLESDFYSTMDNDLDIVIKEIVGLIKSRSVPNLDADTRMFLAHGLVIDAGRRNPDYRTDLMEATQRSDFKATILGRIPDQFDIEAADVLYDELTADPEQIKFTANKSRRFLLSEGVKSLTDKPFRYLIPPDRRTFVLGNPLVRPSRSYIIPIDPRLAIAFRAPDGPSIGKLTRSSRNKINEDIFAASSRVIATSDAYLRVLAGKRGKMLTFYAETDRPNF